jgi:outer membrane protein assembly factor BamD (BamD/ComL family)
MKLSTSVLIAFVVFVTALAAVAQEPPSDNKHGIMVRVTPIYVSPDTSSQKLGEATRGREVFVIDESGAWAHVLASLGGQKDVTGWILNKGIVHLNTPDGDKILFGEVAPASELEASRRGGRKGAGDDARRLYYRVFDYFPQSDLAGEGLYRAADIVWQMESHNRDRSESTMVDLNNPASAADETMKLVIKKFPHTKWADMAAFHLLDDKLCADWAGQSKCPDKEADMYEKYAAEHPDSPNAPEALYNAATRRAALIEIYKTEDKPKQIEESRARVKADGNLLTSKYPQTDWAYRARSLMFTVDQGIPTYGNALQ